MPEGAWFLVFVVGCWRNGHLILIWISTSCCLGLNSWPIKFLTNRIRRNKKHPQITPPLTASKIKIKPAWLKFSNNLFLLFHTILPWLSLGIKNSLDTPEWNHQNPSTDPVTIPLVTWNKCIPLKYRVSHNGVEDKM